MDMRIKNQVLAGIYIYGCNMDIDVPTIKDTLRCKMPFKVSIWILMSLQLIMSVLVGKYNYRYNEFRLIL